MAKESVKILQKKLDVESLLSQLNAALSEEWLAYYQYWVGALVAEAHHAQSSADFLNKMNVALKEANETFYWLSLLRDTDYLSEQIYKSISIDCKELIALLVSIVKSVKSSLGR